MSKIKCVVCQTQIEIEEVSQYAAFSGLPSPCCNTCFDVRDYTDTSIETVAAKSLLKRAKSLAGEEVKSENN